MNTEDKPLALPSPSERDTLQATINASLTRRSAEGLAGVSMDSYPFLSFGASSTACFVGNVDPPGYEILGELGRGGMGVVYKARQTCLNRLVAIKMILADAYASPEEQARFHREAEAVARLQHPNIVQVHEISAHEGRPFFSLEYVDGGSLASRLNGQPMLPRQAATLVETLARAIHATHEHGIIHRDIKPGNILLTQDGVPKITDFGLAKCQDRESGQTQSGTLIGTPSYMPPEQIRGGVGGVIGPPTDVYALGAVLYELLAGRPPFLAATPLDTVFQVLSRDPAPPSHLQSRVPRDLETICLKCLSKSPSKRYPSALALAEDLGRFLAGQAILARPVPFWERGLKWARRHKAAAFLLCLLALTPVAGFVAALRQYGSIERRRQDVTAELDKLAKENYGSNIFLADRLWQQNSCDQARELLDGCPLHLRGWEWHYLRNSWQMRLQGVHAPGGARIVYAPDGRALAADRAGETIQVWDGLTGQPILKVAAGRPALALSHDGGLLAAPATDQRAVQIWDTSTGKLIRSISVERQLLRELAFSPDAQLLAVAGAEGLLDVFPLLGAGAPVRCRSAGGTAAGFIFSPNSAFLAAANADGAVSVCDADSGKELGSLPAPQTAPGSSFDDEAYDPHESGVTACAGVPLAFSPNGRWLARAWRDNIELWHWQKRQRVRTLHGHTGKVLTLEFGPDGASLVSGGSDRTVLIWDVATGEKLHTLRGHAGPVRQVAFSPNGERVAVIDPHECRVWDATPEARTHVAIAGGPLPKLTINPRTDSLATAGPGGRITLWNASTGQLSQTWNGHDTPIQCLTVSPDGRLLASAAQDRTVKIWDAADGRLIAHIDVTEQSVTVLAFNGDGRLLATAGQRQPIRMWDTGNGQLVRSLPDTVGAASCLCFGPHSDYLACCDQNGKVRRWPDGVGRQELEVELGEGPVTLLASSPATEDQWVVAANARGKVSFLRAAKAGTVTSHYGHAGAVAALAFSPKGGRLVTAGADRVVKLWDVGTAQEFLTLGTFDVPILAVAFTPDGNRIRAVLHDGTIKTWDGTPAAARPSQP